MGSLETSDAESAAVQKTPHRITLDSMKDKIADVSYINPPIHPTMTICVMQLSNGFVLVGKSAPADPENFNEPLGQKFAFEDCIRQMWPLEGYALRDRLTRGD